MIILRQLWNIITAPPYKHINNELGIKMSDYDFILQIRLSDEIKLWKHAWAGNFLPTDLCCDSKLTEDKWSFDN